MCSLIATSILTNATKSAVCEAFLRGVLLLQLQRHYRLAHGIGRSGDIAAPQPKVSRCCTLLVSFHDRTHNTASAKLLILAFWLWAQRCLTNRRQLQAAGSSLLQRLTNLLAADALRLAGLPEVGAAL